MHLIVTRPQDDAGPLCELLHGLGHETAAMPLLGIAPIDGVTLPAGPWQAVLVTSANSVRAAQQLGFIDALADTPVMAVGDASAEAARAAGFSQVSSASGDLASLAALVRERLEPGAGTLLYLSGVVVSGDLKALLQQDGFSVDRAAIYRAEPVEALSAEIADGLKQGRFEGVLLYSPRSAAVWSDLVARAGLAVQAARLDYFCLSQAVADKLAPDQVRAGRIRVASDVTQAALIDLIGAAAAG